jgi:hypothetical protein
MIRLVVDICRNGWCPTNCGLGAAVDPEVRPASAGSFGVTVPTAHRRFTDWTKAGVWRRLHHAVLDQLGSQGLLDWSRAVLDGASARPNGGSLIRGTRSIEARPARRSTSCPTAPACRCQWPYRPPTPTTPFCAQALGESEPGDPIPPRTTAGQPAKLHADKAYDHHELRTWLRRRDIIVRIARKGIETSKLQ